MNLESKPFTKIYCRKELLKALDTVLQDKNKEQMKEEKIQEEKKPLFKVGQIVRIKVREGRSGDYAYYFTDEMTKFSGRLCTIAHVYPNFDSGEHKYPDDGARYELGEDGPRHFGWASSMLEETELPEPSYRLGQKVRIVNRQTSDGEPLIYGDVHYTDVMLKHKGEVHEIDGIDFHTGAYLPQDDYHIYRLKKRGYSWTKTMLELIEDTPKSKDEADTMEDNSEHVDQTYLTYKLARAMNWPEDAKFCYNQKVQIPSVITSDTKGFKKRMINYAGNEGNIETVVMHPELKEYFYRLDEKNGGDIWWPESLLTEIN